MPELQLISNDATDVQGRASRVAASLRKTFESGTTKPLAWRLGQLDALEHLLREREADIIEALREDLRKPPNESYGAEIGTILAELSYTRKRLPSWMRPERVPTPLVAQPGRSTIVREPLGSVLIIAPWNYPFQTAVLPLVGALAAGNCVVVKPSEVAPATSALLASWLPRYLDRGAVQVFEGGVPETTALLREKWDHIFYTGNGKVGRIVMEAAARHLTPVTLELGGKSPCIVDESADLDVAAKRIVFGKFYNAGQTCVAPDHVLVHEAVHDALINRMVSTVREFYGDDPQRSPDFARIINERHHARLTRLLDGANVVTGGETDAADRYIAPTILRDVSPNDPVMQEEIFGPILPVISVSSVEAAIAYVNRGAKPLALYVFSRSKPAQERIVAGTSAGGTTINHVWMHLGVPGLPFGGVGDSGMGAYHGKHSFEAFSHRRAVLKKSNLSDPPLVFPPYAPWKLKWLKRLL
jgi:aldehyde dehydrogenase (NAD+)